MIPQQIPSKKAIQEHKLIGKLTAPAVRFFCAGDAGMEVFCMCGIVGYVGKRSAQDVLLDGLEKLEYRGYDSAGVALALDGGIRVVKMPAAHNLPEVIRSPVLHLFPST